jgi:hypothetical protein
VREKIEGNAHTAADMAGAWVRMVDGHADHITGHYVARRAEVIEDHHIMLMRRHLPS